MKTIELTKEQLEKLLNSESGEIYYGDSEVTIRKKVEKWEPKGGGYIVDGSGKVCDTIIGEGKLFGGFGSLRETREQAERAAKEMRKFNRLLAYRDEFDPEYRFTKGISNYYIGFNFDDDSYYTSVNIDDYIPTTVYMSEKVAEELCRKLNSGEVCMG